MGRRGGGKGRGSPQAWEPRAGGYPGDLLEGFHWPLEALAASQVSILGHFQPLISPLCCVCPSSSSFPDPMHCHSPSCSCSRSLALSPTPSLPLPHHEQKILWYSRGQPETQDSHTQPCTGGWSPTGPQEKAVPLTRGQRDTQCAHHIQSQGPALGIGSPQSF